MRRLTRWAGGKTSLRRGLPARVVSCWLRRKLQRLELRVHMVMTLRELLLLHPWAVGNRRKAVGGTSVLGAESRVTSK